ncbi:MAG TPA: beta-propeller fold lactonase family protein, partial [Polyangiaceae bacterium]
MRLSSQVSLGLLSALTLLIVNCGGSDGSAGSRPGVGGSGPFQGAGGSGLASSTIGGNRAEGGVGAGSLGDVLTISGTSGGSGSVDGPGRFGVLAQPQDMATDGEHIYITQEGERYGVASLELATGVITTLAGGDKEGYANGIGAAARFNGPSGIGIDPTHQYLYVADRLNQAIRRVVIATGEVSTLAGDSLNPRSGSTDGIGDAAAFSWPEAVAIDSKGKHLYVADSGNHEIRSIDLTTNEVSTLAGSPVGGFTDGIGSAAAFAWPEGIAINATDSTLYVADNQNQAIRVIDIATKNVTSYAGFKESGKYGTERSATLSNLSRLAIDPTGKYLYLSNSNGGAIRKLDVTNFTSTLLAGTDTDVGFADGPSASALFDVPKGLLLTDDGVLIADSNNHRIRKIELSTNAVTTFAGSDKAASFSGPRGITSVGSFLYVTDARGGRIRKVSMSSGDATTLSDGTGTALNFSEPCGIATD